MVRVRLLDQLPERISQLDRHARRLPSSGFFLGICTSLHMHNTIPVVQSHTDTAYRSRSQLTVRMYFSASSFLTIDGGLNRLPLSFEPHVKNITTFNRKIERITYDASTKKVHLLSRNSFTSKTFKTSTHDYAIISAPFTVVRRWRLPPLPTTLTNAIQNLAYMSGCKVALEFRTRFWEHYPTPIYGGCSTTTDIWGIGEICYPSYNLNGTGPASILASWAPIDWGERWVSVSEAEHVAYVLEVMEEIHGPVIREQYTGKYNRKCWLLEETGGWASPTVGQHQLYMPEYFKTHSNVGFPPRVNELLSDLEFLC